MQRHVRTERPAGSQGRAHFNRFPEHGGEKRGWSHGHPLVPESGLDVFAGKPDQAVALANETRKVLDLFDRTFGNVCEDHDVHFVQFLGRKRNPRNRSDYESSSLIPSLRARRAETRRRPASPLDPSTQRMDTRSRTMETMLRKLSAARWSSVISAVIRAGPAL